MMEYFRVNEKIEIYFENAGGNQRMEGIISDVTEDQVCISISADDRHFKLLHVGEEVYGIAYAKNQTAGFKAVLKDRLMSQTPTYILSGIKEVEKVQRRKYVRVDYSIDMRYTFKDKIIKKLLEVEDPVTLMDELDEGVMIDLSAGGMSFACQNDVVPGVECLVFFELEGKTFCLPGSTTRKEIIGKENGFKYIYGIMFDEIEERLKEEIVSFLFKVMRRNARR